MSNLSGRGQLTGFMRTGGGGGGSEVVINPSGAAIGTMEKISVDGDIYEVRNVPDATSASNGDVLTRSASGVGWYPPTKELPVYTSSDNNKVLAINNDTLTWETIPKELPNILSSDEGKVLTVSNGVPSWQEGGSGSANYSTTEHVVGTWIDGRDVYEKTIYYASKQGRGSVFIDNYPTTLDVDYFTLNEISYTINNTYYEGVPIVMEVACTTSGVALDNNNAPSGFPTNFTDIYVTIRYVKKAGE